MKNSCVINHSSGLQPPLIFVVEAVEKVPMQIPGRDAEKGDLIEWATINDLILGKPQVTRQDIGLTGQSDFFYRLVSQIQSEISQGNLMTIKKYIEKRDGGLVWISMKKQ
jgi:hypothetical protein